MPCYPTPTALGSVVAIAAGTWALNAVPAAALHGTAITIHPNDGVELVIAFDPADETSPAGSYLTSPYGFARDVIAAAVDNQSAFRSVDQSVTIFLDFDLNGDVLYSASRRSPDGWEAIEQRSYGAPAGTRFVQDVICEELLGIECTAAAGPSPEAADAPAVAYDRADLATLESAPLVSIGPFPPSPASQLNVYTDATAMESASAAEAVPFDRAGIESLPPDARISGSVGDAIDYWARSRTTAEPADGEEEELRAPMEDVPARDEPPFEQRSSVTSELEVAEGYDQRLRYITLHCTGPGILPASTIRGYAGQGRRNKGHGYIMPDGEYIKIASITDNPNRTYATKTETCVREKAMRTMFNIELNYDCHWRPNMSGNPTDAMLERLADVIIWIHQNVGDLALVSHTYVDMGLRDGHTDPQGNPDGFDWQGLYDTITERGGSLDGIVKVDPTWARGWKISLTDRAHAFPPVINQPIPTGRDECRQYAGD